MPNAARSALDAGFHIVVPVWGESYTRLFVELCLPTLIAPGNIPGLPFPDRHVFAIYTTERDRQAIEAAPVFARLTAHIKVEFHPVRARVDGIASPYDLQSDCYRREIRRADAADRAVVFLTPDLIVADGSLRGLARIAGTSARAVVGVGIRLDKTSMRDYLLANHRSGDAVTIAPRDLVRAALDRLHPMAKAHFSDADGDEIGLSNLYWRVAGEGLLARCFHLHPFLVYPRIKNAPFSRSVDGDYVEAACPDPSDIHVIADSDEFCAWELSDPDRREPTIPYPLRAEDLSKWVDENVGPRHRVQIRTPIRIHFGIRDFSAWHGAERESGKAVGALLATARSTSERQPRGLAGAAGGLRFLTVIRDAIDARRFVAFALPSVLGLGNIPRLPRHSASRYTIVLPAECVPLVGSSPELAELREYITVDLRAVGDGEARGAGPANAFRAETLRQAALGDGLAIFVEPDEVISTGSLSAAHRMCRSGIRALVAPRLALDAELAEPQLHACKVEGLLSVRSEDLVSLALEGRRAASAPSTNHHDAGDPGTLLWPVENEGLIMHTLAFDPVIVYPRCPPPSVKCFDDILLGSGVRETEIGLFNDSGPFTRCRLRAEATETVPHRDRAAWAVAHTTPLQRALLRCGMRFRAGPVRGPGWNSVEVAAAAGVRTFLSDIEAVTARRVANG